MVGQPVNSFTVFIKVFWMKKFLITLPMGQFIPYSQQLARKDRKLPRGIFYRQFHQEGIKSIFISCPPLFLLEQAKQLGSGNQDISRDLPEVRHFCLQTQSLCATHTPCSCFLVLAVQIQNRAKAWRGLHTMYIYFGVDSWLFLDENFMRYTIGPGLNMEHTLFPQSRQLQTQDQAGGSRPCSLLSWPVSHGLWGVHDLNMQYLYQLSTIVKNKRGV